MSMPGALVAAEGVEITPQADRVTIKVDGELLTELRWADGPKPYFYPVIGPGGVPVTRHFPMRRDRADEEKDHPHQRSFWFTHGEVNGIDFWAETAKVQGRIEHKELVKAEGGKTGTIVTRNEWVGPDGGKVLADERTLRFGADDTSRWIDFDITLTALADEVKFGDTKEGSFGLRIAESMRADHKQNKGTIVTSEGLVDGAAWGKPASWVDYHGPVQGETLGIAILNHPSSFRYPTGWHVRTYGLFAANPFGEGDFRGEQVETAYTMKKGESLSLRYRVIFHAGDEKKGKIAEAFATYAKE